MDDRLNLEELKQRGQTHRQIIQNTRIAAFVSVCITFGSILIATSVLNDVRPGTSEITTFVTIMAMLGIIAAFLVLFLGYRPMMRLNVERSTYLRGVLHELGLTPGIENYTQSGSAKSGQMTTYLFYAFILVLNVLGNRFLDVDPNLLYLVSLVLITLFMLRRSILNAFNSSINQRLRRNSQRAIVSIVLLISSFFFIAILIQRVLVSLRLPFEAAYALLVFSVLTSLCLVWIGVRSLFLYPYRLLLHGSLARADYDGALHELAHLRQRIPFLINDETFQCFILSYAARPAEAEALSRQALAEAPFLNLNEMVYAIFNLGASLVGQKQYEEALPLFEAAITAYPDDSRFYRGLIDYHLLSGKDVERALEISEVMMYFYHKPRFYTLALTRIDSVVTRCGRALVLAQAGQIDKAERVLSLSHKEAPHYFQPVMAILSVTQGQVYQIKGDISAATAALNEAIKLDPNGLARKMANTVFESLDSATYD